jgi:hypothetical protein
MKLASVKTTEKTSELKTKLLSTKVVSNGN